MTQYRPGRFDEIRERLLQDPQLRERSERSRRSFARVQALVELMDQRRQMLGLSKAELARRAGMNPAALRRLLTSGAGNPTLKTLFDLLDVLGIEVRLHEGMGFQPGELSSSPRPAEPVSSVAEGADSGDRMGRQAVQAARGR